LITTLPDLDTLTQMLIAHYHVSPETSAMTRIRLGSGQKSSPLEIPTGLGSNTRKPDLWGRIAQPTHIPGNRGRHFCFPTTITDVIHLAVTTRNTSQPSIKSQTKLYQPTNLIMIAQSKGAPLTPAQAAMIPRPTASRKPDTASVHGYAYDITGPEYEPLIADMFTLGKDEFVKKWASVCKGPDEMWRGPMPTTTGHIPGAINMEGEVKDGGKEA